MCSNRLDRLRKFRLRILDNVALIKNAVMPIHLLQRVDIIPDDFVRGDDDVVVLQLWEHPVPFARVPRVHDRLEIVDVFLDLVEPVASQSWWADDEGWDVNRVGRLGLLVSLVAFVVLARKDADRLECLAKTHIWFLRISISDQESENNTSYRHKGYHAIGTWPRKQAS